VVPVEVTAFVAVAGVCVAAVELSASATGASAPVVVPASESGASATVAIGVLPEVAVEGADPGAVAAGTADPPKAELTVPDPELVEPLAGAEAPEPVAPPGELGAAGAAPEVACDAVEVTGDVAELTTEVTGERGDAGSVSEVAACACRENRSMITKIPAATIASCTARRAMRRRIGCGTSSSHSPETGRGTRAHYRGLQSRAPRPS